MKHNAPIAARNEHQVFRLRDLIKPDLALWVMSGLLGLCTAVSVIGLLMTAGWFLSVTAVLGGLTVTQSAHSLPAVLIRVFALTRTLGRYAELVVAHNAIFSLLRDMRVRFFRVLANQPLTHQRQSLQASGKMHRLVTDINALNEFNLRIVLPWLTALVVVTTIVVASTYSVPIVAQIFSQTLVELPSLALNVTGSQLAVILTSMLATILGLCIAIPTLMAWLSISYNRNIATLGEARRNALLSPLTIITQLLMWQQWHKQTQDFIVYDEQLHQQHWRAEKQKAVVLLVIQWLLSTVIVLILLTLALLFMNTGFNAAIFESVSPMMFLGIGLACLFGVFGLQEVLLPLAQHYVSYGKARIAKERLNEMLGAEQKSTENHQSSHDTSIASSTHKPLLSPLPSTDVSMELVAVSAKIPSAIIGATDVSLKVIAGTPMIISGASGCGKSTLLQTLAHELPIQSGNILLNGQHWQKFDWADQLGYLGQQLDIFDQTLADNLRLGKADASDEELLAVLDKVALTDWIQAQPQGLQTQLGEYGTAVSGGQARRIALARLLLKPRVVLLLDEPFAGLDKASQAKLWQAIREHQQSALLIVVSHHQSWQDMGVVDRYSF